MNRFTSSRTAGFSMIEVLVSLLLIVIGVMGMFAMQSKAIPYTQDSTQRNTAIMMADDLLELIRASKASYDTGTVASTNLAIANAGYSKAVGAAFPTTTGACVPTPTAVSDRMACWAKRLNAALPVTSDSLTNQTYVCWNSAAGLLGAQTACTGGTNIEIQIAWTVKAGECLDQSDTALSGTTCVYRIRTQL